MNDTCEHGISLFEDHCSQCGGAPRKSALHKAQHAGYNHATMNQDCMTFDYDKSTETLVAYLRGYEEGLAKRVEWSTRDLDSFQKRYSHILK